MDEKKWYACACYVCGKTWFEEFLFISAMGISLPKDKLTAVAHPGTCPSKHDGSLIRQTWANDEMWVEEYDPLPTFRTFTDSYGRLRVEPI